MASREPSGEREACETGWAKSIPSRTVPSRLQRSALFPCSSTKPLLSGKNWTGCTRPERASGARWVGMGSQARSPVAVLQTAILPSRVRAARWLPSGLMERDPMCPFRNRVFPAPPCRSLSETLPPDPEEAIQRPSREKIACVAAPSCVHSSSGWGDWRKVIEKRRRCANSRSGRSWSSAAAWANQRSAVWESPAAASRLPLLTLRVDSSRSRFSARVAISSLAAFSLRL